MTDPTNALETQVGGSHYKDMAIQPIEYAQKNGLNACEFNVVKYVSRHRFKGGRTDLEKAIHMCQVLIELEYPQPSAEHEDEQKKACLSPMDHDCVGLDCKDCQYYISNRKDSTTKTCEGCEGLHPCVWHVSGVDLSKSCGYRADISCCPWPVGETGGDAPVETCAFFKVRNRSTTAEVTTSEVSQTEANTETAIITEELANPPVSQDVGRVDAPPDLQIGDRAKRIVDQFRSLGADSRHIGFVAADEPGATENDILDAVLVSPILAYDAKRRYVKLIDSQNVGREDEPTEHKPPGGTTERFIWEMIPDGDGAYVHFSNMFEATGIGYHELQDIIHASSFLTWDPYPGGRTVSRKDPS